MLSGAQFWGPVAASVAVLAIAYGPLLIEFFQNQWAQPQYQFFPFVLAAFGWLLWRSCSQSRPREATGGAVDRFAMVALLVAAWGLLALAYVAGSPWLAIISAILLVASRFVRVADGWRVEYLWGIWALLWLLVPLPLHRDQLIVSKLQQASSRLSSFFLDWLGVHHLMDGNALILPDKEFFVDEACSGIVSVMSVIACAAIYGVWRNRSPLHVILLAIAGVGWATLMNVVRITSIAVAHNYWGVDWSKDTPHEILGLVVFTITFLMLVSTDYLLLALLAPIIKNDNETPANPIRYGARLTSWWDQLQARGALQTANDSDPPPPRSGGRYELWSRFALGVIPLLVFATLAGAQFTVSHWIAQPRDPSPRSMQQALALQEDALPFTIGQLERVSFEAQERDRDDLLGQYSRVYQYRDEEGNEYLLSCDFPLETGGHELTVCYKGIGWEQVEATVAHQGTERGPKEWPYLQAEFTKPEGSAGLLVYCAFDEHGERLTPPTHTLVNDLWLSLQKKHRSKQPTRSFTIQVWTVAAGKVRDGQTSNARELLLATREQLRQSVTNLGEPTDSSAR